MTFRQLIIKLIGGVCITCDVKHCGRQSPTMLTPRGAHRLAWRLGWWVQSNHDTGAQDYCPAHVPPAYIKVWQLTTYEYWAAATRESAEYGFRNDPKSRLIDFDSHFLREPVPAPELESRPYLIYGAKTSTWQKQLEHLVESRYGDDWMEQKFPVRFYIEYDLIPPMEP